MNTTRIKVCGITEYRDAALAAGLGAHALGFIFAPSPRRISREKAREIIRSLPPFIKSVGVFVDEDPTLIRESITFCGLDMVQLHGRETPETCGEFMPRTIKAFRIKGSSSLEIIKPYQEKCRAILLDTYSEDSMGGTGKTFDWDLALEAKDMGVPVILAGGLDTFNIEEAISRVHPFAIDINSGIEESPGKKNHELMRELFDKILKANCLKS